MTCEEYTETVVYYGIYTVFSEEECQELTSSMSTSVYWCIYSGVTTTLIHHLHQ